MVIWWRHNLADHVGERILAQFADGCRACIKVLSFDPIQPEPTLTYEMVGVLDWGQVDPQSADAPKIATIKAATIVSWHALERGPASTGG